MLLKTTWKSHDQLAVVSAKQKLQEEILGPLQNEGAELEKRVSSLSYEIDENTYKINHLYLGWILNTYIHTIMDLSASTKTELKDNKEQILKSIEVDEKQIVDLNNGIKAKRSLVKAIDDQIFALNEKEKPLPPKNQQVIISVYRIYVNLWISNA